jgi:hypothetical protein
LRWWISRAAPNHMFNKKDGCTEITLF